MTQQAGSVPEDAVLRDAPPEIGSVSGEPMPISWQTKLAFCLLLSWTLFLAWIAFA